MNERALNGFVKVVELGSFTAAAEALAVSQSALSQQIRTLENQLAFDLFQHGARQVILTAAGRSFYPRAKQMLQLYQTAVQEGRAIQQDTRLPDRHMRIACQNQALAAFCFDLFALSPETSVAFAPLIRHCANRSDVWRALADGEADLSFQPECAEIAARGLRFWPLLHLPELCIPFNAPEQLPQQVLTLEDALTCRWIFAFPGEETTYESELAREAARQNGVIVAPNALGSIQYGLPTLALLQGIYYRRPNFDFVRILRWGSGSRFGIVTADRPDETVARYSEAIRQVVRARRHQLFGLVPQM